MERTAMNVIATNTQYFEIGHAGPRRLPIVTPVQRVCYFTQHTQLCA